MRFKCVNTTQIFYIAPLRHVESLDQHWFYQGQLVFTPNLLLQSVTSTTLHTLQYTLTHLEHNINIIASPTQHLYPVFYCFSGNDISLYTCRWCFQPKPVSKHTCAVASFSSNSVNLWISQAVVSHGAWFQHHQDCDPRVGHLHADTCTCCMDNLFCKVFCRENSLNWTVWHIYNLMVAFFLAVGHWKLILNNTNSLFLKVFTISIATVQLNNIPTF